MEQKLTNLVHFTKQLIQSIEAMQSQTDPDWFGDFLHKENPIGVIIEWPNLRICLADLQTALHEWEGK